MKKIIPVVINQSSINNGRIYIDTSHQLFFGDLRLGSRSKGELGDLVTIEAGGDSYETDIRQSSGVRLSPRKSFKQYLEAVGAVVGAQFQLVEIAPRRFRLEPSA